MFDHKGVNFTGYPSFDYEEILDKLEYAEIEESPLGVTLLGITKQDIDILKAVFGRNNGFKVPHAEAIRPIEVTVEHTNVLRIKEDTLYSSVMKYLGLMKRD